MLSNGNRSKSQFSLALSIDIYCDKLEGISDLKIFPECFLWALKTLWWATCGLQATYCPPLY